MAHLWTKNIEGLWQPRALPGEGCWLAGDSGTDVLSPDAKAGEIRIEPSCQPGLAIAWALLTSGYGEARVNGQRLPLGIRVLRERDEITFGGHRCFFSTEELARVVEFPALPQAVFCPRCKQTLEAGKPAVACPRCRAWHHQSEEFPCWTYGASCALCQAQTTALDSGYSWTPESL